MADPQKAEAIARLAVPFFQQGAPRVFIAVCCSKLFVGIEPPVRCKTCKQVPKAHEVATVHDAVGLADTL
jgi:hypothetical protein